MSATPETIQWIEGLRGFATLVELQRSDFFRRYEPDIRKYLNTPERAPFPGASAHLKRFLRAVSWNIEKGIHWRRIAEVLRVDPYFRTADLIFLNEVDVGMARSGNVHVARELAQVLKMNCVFAPAHLEITKGTGRDLQAPGENQIGVQGNAVLSRYPLEEAHVIELPACHDAFASEEKRYGRRTALQVLVYTDKGSFWAVCTHLEVRDTPACRWRQMRTILDALESDDEAGAVLIGGDWNTHSFARGTRLRTLRAYLRIGLSNPQKLAERLRHPDKGSERLFNELSRRGYSWQDFNDDADTCGIPLPGIEDMRRMPKFLEAAARRRIAQHQGRLRFRLDWFAASAGLRALRKNEETDLASGVASVGPMTRGEVNEGEPLSDHDPILVDIHLPPEENVQIRNAA